MRCRRYMCKSTRRGDSCECKKWMFTREHNDILSCTYVNPYSSFAAINSLTLILCLYWCATGISGQDELLMAQRWMATGHQCIQLGQAWSSALPERWFHNREYMVTVVLNHNSIGYMSIVRFGIYFIIYVTIISYVTILQIVTILQYH